MATIHLNFKSGSEGKVKPPDPRHPRTEQSSDMVVNSSLCNYCVWFLVASEGRVASKRLRRLLMTSNLFEFLDLDNLCYHVSLASKCHCFDNFLRKASPAFDEMIEKSGHFSDSKPYNTNHVDIYC